jgi:hypothetical protein
LRHTSKGQAAVAVENYVGGHTEFGQDRPRDQQLALPTPGNDRDPQSVESPKAVRDSVKQPRVGDALHNEHGLGKDGLGHLSTKRHTHAHPDLLGSIGASQARGHTVDRRLRDLRFGPACARTAPKPAQPAIVRWIHEMLGMGRVRHLNC